MNHKEMARDWKWRIVKAGYTQSSFARLFKISKASLSEYISGKKSPSIERFQAIENKLEEMGV